MQFTVAVNQFFVNKQGVKSKTCSRSHQTLYEAQQASGAQVQDTKVQDAQNRINEINSVGYKLYYIQHNNVDTSDYIKDAMIMNFVHEKIQNAKKIYMTKGIYKKYYDHLQNLFRIYRKNNKLRPELRPGDFMKIKMLQRKVYADMYGESLDVNKMFYGSGMDVISPILKHSIWKQFGFTKKHAPSSMEELPEEEKRSQEELREDRLYADEVANDMLLTEEETISC